MSISLIVEGPEDVQFLRPIILYFFKVDLSKKNFIEIGGDSRSLNKVRAEIQNAKIREKQLIAILDADRSVGDASENAQAWFDENNFDADLFMTPNNQDPGNLETLLQQLMPENYRPMESCTDQYIDCVNQTELISPLDDKSKFFIYSQGSKGRDRECLNELWDLSSPALAPLVSFLRPYFEQVKEQ